MKKETFDTLAWMKQRKTIQVAVGYFLESKGILNIF